MPEVYTGYNPKLKSLARELRKNQTPEERRLWYEFLRSYPVQFQRQRPIEHYIADFYCSKAKLVIELDGSQHFTEEGIAYDALRTEIIEQLGLKVLRFTNQDINKNFPGVCRMIDAVVKERIALDV